MKKTYNIIAYRNDKACPTNIVFDNEADAKLFCKIFEKMINEYDRLYAAGFDGDLDEDSFREYSVIFDYEEGYKYDNALDFFKNNNFDKCLEFMDEHSLDSPKLDWELMNEAEKEMHKSYYEKFINKLIKAEAKKQKENEDELSMQK